MSLGLNGKLNILQKSPLDCGPSPALGGPEVEAQQHWVPSRYTIRATAEDGRLVLWNTMSGKITAFKATDRERVLAILGRSGLAAPKEGVVKYLVDRGYLIRKGVDEYQKFQQLFGQAHYRTDVLELILLASEDCNFRCTYCYEDFKRGTMVPEVREGIKRLVEKRIKKLNRLHISWFGGEPLYGWEAIEDLAPFFLDIANANEVSFGGHMTTNGYLLTPDIAEKLLAWRINNFQITLDGLPEHHNHSRAARDGSPTYDRIFSNLKALRDSKEQFHVTLRVNVDRSNAGGLSTFVDLLANEFSHDHRFVLAFKMVGRWGGSNDANIDVCSGSEASALQEDLAKQARLQGLRLGTIKDVSRIGSQICYAARPYNFLIGATGKVMKCTIALDKKEHNIVGELDSSGDLHLETDKLAAWTEPAFEKDGQCQKCVVLPTCQGISCPLPRVESGNRSCISERVSAKKSLIDSLSLLKDSSRPRTVGVSHVGSLENT